MKYQNLLLALSLFISNALFSQTLLFGGSNGNGNFENGTVDWVIVNGTQINKWVIGNNATPGFSGNNAIYISSSPDAPYAHHYDENRSSDTYFYRDVAVPAGTQRLWLVFDYICNGETIQQSYGTFMKDALTVGAVSTSTPIIAGQGLNMTDFEWYYGKTQWSKKQVQYLDATAYAGKTIRVVFQWANNYIDGNQVPAALDNIEMYASCIPFVNLTLRNARPSGAQLSWYTVSGATGYELRYKKLGAPAYTNTVTIGSGSTTAQEITDLTPSTTYVAQVRPIGTSCNDYSDSLVFSTLTPPANDSCSGATQLTVEGNTAEGIWSTFYGATPTADLAISCPGGSSEDVWFKFTAQQSKQIIQTMNDPEWSLYSSKNITLFSGTCGSLQPVNLPCTIDYSSVAHNRPVSQLIATGLTVGETYYIRVNKKYSSGYDAFKITVHNEPPLPQCPQLITPANNTVNLNQYIPQVFKWNKAENAYGYYKIRVQAQMGFTLYTYIRYTNDTTFTYTPDWSGTYTWEVIPYNVVEGSAACGKFNFTTCPSVASGITIASASTAKCTYDSIKITATPASANRQWFLNNEPIPGATADSVWTKLPGTYTIRVLNGSCYSDPSNSITISNLNTPPKPVLTVQGSTTFCEGESVTLSQQLNFTSQWFNNAGAISGATSYNYTATQPGEYYIRLKHSSTGCYNYSDTVSVMVKPIPASPVITAGGALTFCSGEGMALSSSATSGNQWYKYGLVINTATEQKYSIVQTGTYTVTTTENGCTSVPSAGVDVTVNETPATPTITASKALAICSGDSVRLLSSYAANYQWYKDGVAITGATDKQIWPKEAGAYTVKVSSSTCQSSASPASVVTVYSLPVQPVITATGNILAVESGSASYQWFLNKVPINGATSNQYTAQQNGLYKVDVTNSNGCKISSNEFNFVASALNEVVWPDYNISLYPNPVQDQLIIKVSATGSAARHLSADVVDVNGKTVKSTRLKVGLNTVRLSDLAQGIYSVILKNEKGQQAVQIIKAH